MGRASRLKQERRRTRSATVEVVCPGMLEILSVGKGDIKLTVGSGGDADDARKIIEEMLAKGYGIFVETDKGLSRVKRFNPKRMTYVISEVVDPPTEQAASAPKTARRPERPRTRDRDVPVAGSRAKAIGRTAGG